MAKEEAHRMKHDRVGTAHILLGMFKLGQDQPLAVNVLGCFNLNYNTLKAQIKKRFILQMSTSVNEDGIISV